MATTPKVFLSAVTDDFGLPFLDQLSFAICKLRCACSYRGNLLQSGTILPEKLRAEIEEASCVVHLVGPRFGFGPDDAMDPALECKPAGEFWKSACRAWWPFPALPTRRSYTQMEYDFAIQLGRPVFVIFVDDPAVVAASAGQAPEEAALQADHRRAIEAHGHERVRVDSVTALATLSKQLPIVVQHLREDVAALVRENERARVKAFAIVLALLAVIALGVWLVAKSAGEVKEQTRKIAAGQQQAVKQAEQSRTDLANQLSRVQEALSRIQQNTDPQRDPISGWSQERLEIELARQMQIEVRDLRAILVAGKTSLDALIQGQALLASGKAKEAGEKFDIVIEQEKDAMKRLRQAYEGKAQIAFDAVRYEEALAFREKAAALVDKAADPIGWAYVQGEVTFIDLHLARYEHAEPLMEEIVRLREEHLGEHDSTLATYLNNLAQLYKATNRLTEAEPLMERALQIDEKGLGTDHPNVAIRLNNLAVLYQATNRLAEAVPLVKRALQIDEKSLGTDHPEVATDLNNLAQLYSATSRMAEAEPLMRRTLAIFLKFTRKTGHAHPHLKAGFANYQILLGEMSVPEAESNERIAGLVREAGFNAAEADRLLAPILGPFEVTVTEVVSTGQGPGLGIRAGDTVRRYAGQEITSRAELIKLRGESKGDAVPLEIRRGGETLHLTAKPGRLGLALEDRPKTDSR